MIGARVLSRRLLNLADDEEELTAEAQALLEKACGTATAADLQRRFGVRQPVPGMLSGEKKEVTEEMRLQKKCEATLNALTGLNLLIKNLKEPDQMVTVLKDSRHKLEGAYIKLRISFADLESVVPGLAQEPAPEMREALEAINA